MYVRSIDLSDPRRLGSDTPRVESLAVGVAQRTTSFSGRAPFAIVAGLALPSFQSRAAGVGHLTATARPSPLFSEAPARLWFPRTVAVGHNEQPLSPVRGADVAGSDARGDHRVTRSGKSLDNDVQPSVDKRTNVLHNDESRVECTNKASELGPET